MKSFKSFVAIIIICIWTSAYAEYVFLKNGRVIEGKIIEDKTKSIVVSKLNGSREDIDRDDILRIHYTQMYTGKLSIMKSNEEVFDAYIVNEDQNSVTFRKEWESTNEFTMNRDDILFMTRKNPTALRLKQEDDGIGLKWTPPFMTVDSYIIYLKQGNAEFINAGDTSSKKFLIKNIKKDTLYRVKITAKDDSGYESLPSKESFFYGTPLSYTYEIVDDPSGNTYSVIIKWRPLVYNGNEVKNYAIFRLDKNIVLEAGRTGSLDFTIKGLKNDEFNSIEIRPLTPDGYAIEGNVIEIPPFYYRQQSMLALRCAYMMPFSDFSGITDPGFGVYADFMLCNSMFKHFSFGIETGYLYFPGIGGETAVSEPINGYTMIPLLAKIQIGFSPVKGVSFYFFTAAGYSFNSINYQKQVWESGAFVTKDIEDCAFEPLVSTGLMAEWQPIDWLIINAGLDYNVILENKVKYQFVTVYAGAGYSF